MTIPMFGANVTPVEHNGRPALRTDLKGSRWPVEVAGRLLGFNHPALARILDVGTDYYLTEPFGQPVDPTRQPWTWDKVAGQIAIWADLLAALDRLGVFPVLQAGSLYDSATGPKLAYFGRWTMAGPTEHIVTTTERLDQLTDHWVGKIIGWVAMLQAFSDGHTATAVGGTVTEVRRWEMQTRAINSLGHLSAWLLLGECKADPAGDDNYALQRALPEPARFFIDRALSSRPAGLNICLSHPAPGSESLRDFVEHAHNPTKDYDWGRFYPSWRRRR